jgi:hypothetical protein
MSLRAGCGKPYFVARTVPVLRMAFGQMGRRGSRDCVFDVKSATESGPLGDHLDIWTNYRVRVVRGAAWQSGSGAERG